MILLCATWRSVHPCHAYIVPDKCFFFFFWLWFKRWGHSILLPTQCTSHNVLSELRNFNGWEANVYHKSYQKVECIGDNQAMLKKARVRGYANPHKGLEPGPPKLRTQDEFVHFSWFMWLITSASRSVYQRLLSFLCGLFLSVSLHVGQIGPLQFMCTAEVNAYAPVSPHRLRKETLTGPVCVMGSRLVPSAVNGDASS